MNLVSTRYAFTSAYLKGEEARGIISDHLDGLLQRPKTIPDALEIIRDTDIGEYLLESVPGDLNTLDDTDESLWRYLGECVNRLLRFKLPSDMTEMLDVYMKKYDILNINIALRGVLMEKTAPMVPVGAIHDQGYLEELSNAKSLDEIADVLIKVNLSDYASIVKNIKEKDSRSTFEGEFRLDSLYYATVLGALKKMDDGSVLTKALGIMIDLSNIQVIFRVALGEKSSAIGEFVLEGGHMLPGHTIKELLSLKISEITGRLEHTEYHSVAQEVYKTYEKEGAVTVVDKVVEKYKFRLLSGLLSPRALSPCNLLWYLFLKELEIRNVRLIFKTLLDGMPSSEIRDYLVTVS